MIDSTKPLKVRLNEKGRWHKAFKCTIEPYQTFPMDGTLYKLNHVLVAIRHLSDTMLCFVEAEDFSSCMDATDCGLNTQTYWKFYGAYKFNPVTNMFNKINLLPGVLPELANIEKLDTKEYVFSDNNDNTEYITAYHEQEAWELLSGILLDKFTLDSVTDMYEEVVG